MLTPSTDPISTPPPPSLISPPRAAAARHIVVSTRAGETPLLSPPPVLAEQEREERVGEGAVYISLVGRVEEGAEEAVVESEAPPVLILHAMGFCYDTVVGGVMKVGEHVAFGPVLGVGMIAAMRYKLFGVVYYHGVSASGGHYTLDVPAVPRAPGASTRAGCASTTSS
ncbi:hypothetical protein B0H14DRAFT_1232598 [Mycena olivaceomarginata]|nr:hypothetical protein B0H14DRAFT_1232598 [Mycena olivaceomarginata]